MPIENNTLTDILKEKKMSDKLTASEALFGFAAWLTCREEKIVFSSHDNAVVIADLVMKFCEVNSLQEPREGWGKDLTHPSE